MHVKIYHTGEYQKVPVIVKRKMRIFLGQYFEYSTGNTIHANSKRGLVKIELMRILCLAEIALYYKTVFHNTRLLEINCSSLRPVRFN
jgi:hypothetical protein